MWSWSDSRTTASSTMVRALMLLLGSCVPGFVQLRMHACAMHYVLSLH